ncbi:MAG: HNH endonuclease [Gammaproteobacteria bacterium]|nr:HNH endonuclease [Gammaproteobacteria bacterium]
MGGLDTPVQWRSIIVPRIPFPAPTILDEKVERSYINSRNEGGRRLRQAVGRGLRSPDAKLDFYLLDPRHEKVRWFVPSRFADAWKNRMVEGRRREVQLSQIERSSYYRKRALAAYGTFCHACGFTPRVDSQIHVHHLHPLHEGERETTLADLVPLCANCHALAHSESPPLALDALRGLVREPVVRAI